MSPSQRKSGTWDVECKSPSCPRPFDAATRRCVWSRSYACVCARVFYSSILRACPFCALHLSHRLRVYPDGIKKSELPEREVWSLFSFVALGFAFDVGVFLSDVGVVIGGCVLSSYYSAGTARPATSARRTTGATRRQTTVCWTQVPAVDLGVSCQSLFTSKPR